MALTLSGTNGVVGAGFTVDASGVSVTAGVGTFSSIGAGVSVPAAGLTGALPTIDGANLTGIGKLIKYATFTHDGYVTGDYRNAPDDITSGYQLINQSYTPAAANSTIVVFSSSLTIGEDSNQNNHFWLSLWNGTTFVSAVSGGARYLNYKSNLNETTLSYIGSFSAGSTDARNIQMRCGGNALTSTTVHINGNANGSYSGSSNRFTIFVAELAPNAS